MSKENIPTSVYRRHLLRAHGGGNYFVFFRLYTRILPKLTALFLQDLINLASMDKTKKEEETGRELFLCTVDFLEESGIGWTEREQKYHLRQLQADGYVEVVRRGIPGRRWVSIDLGALENALDSQSVQKRTDCSVQKPADKKDFACAKSLHREELSSSPGTRQSVRTSLDGTSSKVPPPFFLDLARQMYAALERKVHFPKKVLLQVWAKQLATLEAPERPREEIAKVLGAALANYGRQYWPVFECARTFVEKYSRIKRAAETVIPELRERTRKTTKTVRLYLRDVHNVHLGNDHVRVEATITEAPDPEDPGEWVEVDRKIHAPADWKWDRLIGEYYRIIDRDEYRRIAEKEKCR